MSIEVLNCFTCNARVPSDWRTGALCLLVETDRGLVLVDTGLGRQDYEHPPSALRALQLVTRTPMDPQQTAVRQVGALGYDPQDVRHIVLTHMHFDHCGGVPDFPWATLHVHRREHAAFHRIPRDPLDLAYVQRHLAHEPAAVLHEEAGQQWFNFPAIRLPFVPQIWLVPLFGHTRGHCGVVVRTGESWLFNVGSAAPIGFTRTLPPWLTRPMVGPHATRLRTFRASHPEVRMTTGHMPLEFFQRESV